MRALILNGEKITGISLTKLSKTISDELESNNFNVEEILLKERNIKDCLGCFKCWVKTPGICIISDYGREVARMVINSDLLIFLTPIVFGSYSYQLKKALDRLIPLISPYFRKVKGEIHHKKRYANYPSILGIGVLTEANKRQAAVFKMLMQRNAINFYAPYFDSMALTKDDIEPNFNPELIKLKIKKIADKAGGKND